jgi:hypothetical protein
MGAMPTIIINVDRRHPRTGRVAAIAMIAWCAWVVLLCGCAANMPVQIWVEDSFEDFTDGVLDASGQNIYVSRSGKVRTIHRFDLNQDGYLDLVFNSSHDTQTYIPASLATATPQRAIGQAALAVQGSHRVEVADLNKDGHLDLLFCPNASGVQHPRRFLTIIWGGADGWPASRSHGLLPAYTPEAVAVTDLNKDGWPDVAVLNSASAWLPGQPDGRIIRIYWGSRDGFVLWRRQDFGVPVARDLAAGDFDGDGAADLAILSKVGIHLLWSTKTSPDQGEPERSLVELADDGMGCLTAADIDNDGQLDLIAGRKKKKVVIVHGNAGRTWAEPIELSDLDASHIATGDLDSDGHADLVLTTLATGRAAGGEQGAATSEGIVRIAWGSTQGYSTANSTVLPADRASATAAGDLDGDGRADLAVAVFQGATTFEGESLLFFNDGERKFSRAAKGIATAGATDVAVVPHGSHAPAGAIFCNAFGGTLQEKVPVDVYWGGPHGFDPDRRWVIPFMSGYECSAADLNEDEYVDLMLMNSGHGRQSVNPTLGVNIYWGSSEGHDSDDSPTILREEDIASSNVADLNRDGYLDLVLGSMGATTPLVIRYGSAQGIEHGQRVALPSPGRSIGTVIADFNRDDWLDIAVTSYAGDRCVRIFWGGPKGFDSEKQKRLYMPSPIPVETADLNADGWLDLIVGSYSDKAAGYHDTATTIFWGSERGFEHSNAQWLPGFTPVGLTVADFDADGYLDYLSPHYHGTAMREAIANYLYWGGPDGLATDRKTILIADSVHDALAGDFDHDGKLDIAMSCHTVHGNHRTDSKIFFNDGKRFTSPRIASLPTRGSHWMYVQDVGHIYHRRWEQTYKSSVAPCHDAARRGRLSYVADVPKGTELVFAVRSAPTEQQLEDRPWQTLKSKRFSLEPTDRYLQYRATFRSDNGDRYPTLDRVHIVLWRS